MRAPVLLQVADQRRREAAPGLLARVDRHVLAEPVARLLGDVLTCEGIEQVLQGRHGIYDMRVSNQRGEVVAMFRGKSAQVQGTVIPEEGQP